jgi:SAM-dependent methyltransferase
MFKCNECRLIFGTPYLAGDGEFYSLAYKNAGYPKEKWEYNISKEIILNNYSNSNTHFNILEIGAGDGSFFEGFKKYCKSSNIFCTEASIYSANILKNKGYTVIDIYITDKNIPEFYKGKFTLICLFQVVEHLTDLHIVLSNLNQLLNINGMVIISVPNYFLREKLIEFEVYLDKPPTHVNCFSKKSFEIIAKKTGLKVENHLIEKTRVLNIIRIIASEILIQIRRKRNINNVNNNMMRRSLIAILYSYAIIKSLFYLPKIIIPNLGVSQLFVMRKLNDIS